MLSDNINVMGFQFYTIDFGDRLDIISSNSMDNGVDITQTNWWSEAKLSIDGNPALDPDNIWNVVDDIYTEFTCMFSILVRTMLREEPSLEYLGWHNHSPGVLIARGFLWRDYHEEIIQQLTDRLADAGIEADITVQGLVLNKGLIAPGIFYISIKEWAKIPELPMRDLWREIVQLIPLDDMIEGKLYLVNKESNQLFMERYLDSIKMRSKMFTLPIGTLGSTEEKHTYINRRTEIITTVETVVEDIDAETATTIAAEFGIPRWIRNGDVVHFVDEGDYRNEGKYIWWKGKLVDLDYEIADNEGSVPPYMTIDHFPSTSYFVDTIAHNYAIWINPQLYAKCDKFELRNGDLLYRVENTKTGEPLFIWIGDVDSDAPVDEHYPRRVLSVVHWLEGVTRDITCVTHGSAGHRIYEDEPHPERCEKNLFFALPYLIKKHSVYDELVGHGVTIHNCVLIDESY